MQSKIPPADYGDGTPSETYAKHEAREKEVMGAGYDAHERAERNSYKPGGPAFSQPRAANSHAFKGSRTTEGKLRLSGHSGAHRIGKR